MLKIVSSQYIKLGQSFLDEIEDVDWGEDEQQQEPIGAIDDSNLDEYLVDDIEEEDTEFTQPEAPGQYMEEIPYSTKVPTPEGIEEIVYGDPYQLLYDSIDDNDIVTFSYTNRHGDYAGIRTVEPHYTFIAKTTGNEVLVSFDRDVNDIRAFIVGNIGADGVRYKGWEFQPRQSIMRGIL